MIQGPTILHCRYITVPIKILCKKSSALSNQFPLNCHKNHHKIMLHPVLTHLNIRMYIYYYHALLISFLISFLYHIVTGKTKIKSKNCEAYVSSCGGVVLLPIFKFNPIFEIGLFFLLYLESSLHRHITT